MCLKCNDKIKLYRVILSLETPNYCLLQIFNEFVNHLTDDELLGITNKTVQHVTLQMLACDKLKVFFQDRIISKTFGHPDLPI